MMRRSARLRRLGVPVLSLLLCASVAAPFTASADMLSDQKDKIEHKLKKADKAADDSSAELAAATSALLAAEQQLNAARTHLAQTEVELDGARALDRQMQTRLDAAEARLATAQADLDAGAVDVEAQEERIREIVVQSYEQGDSGLLGLSMVFTSQDPARLAGDLNASNTVVDAQSAALDQLEAAKVLLRVKEQETQSAKDEVALRRAEAAANLVKTQTLEEQAKAAENQVSTLVSLRVQVRDNALKAKRADLKQLAAIQAERDRIEALILAQTTIGGAYTGVPGNGFLDPAVPGAPITSPFGYRIHPIYGYRSFHDGIDFGAACGTPIVATANGTVISEYFQTAYGNRIIIDHGLHHGVGLATISNHLSSYAVATGEKVTRGEVIGYVGTTGWSTGCHLHFTVLNNGTAVDPMIWL